MDCINSFLLIFECCDPAGICLALQTQSLRAELNRYALYSFTGFICYDDAIYITGIFRD